MATDQRPPGSGPVPQPAVHGFEETLSVPLRWWALATMFWASVLLAFLVAMPVGAALGICLTLGGLTALLFSSYGGARVAVTPEELLAGRARIPLRHLADPVALDSEQVHRLAGVGADARAYLLLRPYTGGGVRVRVVDPDDPTPYWLVSTRHAAALAQALEAAIPRG